MKMMIRMIRTTTRRRRIAPHRLPQHSHLERRDRRDDLQEHGIPVAKSGRFPRPERTRRTRTRRTRTPPTAVTPDQTLRVVDLRLVTLLTAERDEYEYVFCSHSNGGVSIGSCNWSGASRRCRTSRRSSKVCKRAMRRRWTESGDRRARWWRPLWPETAPAVLVVVCPRLDEVQGLIGDLSLFSPLEPRAVSRPRIALGRADGPG